MHPEDYVRIALAVELVDEIDDALLLGAPFLSRRELVERAVQTLLDNLVLAN